jgi:uncharacterized membrane protein (UPF0127 family)
MKKTVILIFFAFFIIVSGCEKVSLGPAEEGQKRGVETMEESTPASVSVSTIAVHSDGKIINVNAEVAITAEERAKGLMGRESLPKNYGMWFVFPYDVKDPFWMKNTLIPLDMIFVGSDMKVVDVFENAVPESTKLIEPRSSYRYVLEVAAGFISENGVKIGDTVESRIGPK